MPSSRNGPPQDDHKIPHRKLVPPNDGDAGTEAYNSSKPPVSHNGSSEFVIDRKGDRRNLEYGAPDRYLVPRFHLAGRGSILGLARNYRITATSETRRDVEDVEIDSSRRSRNQSLLAHVPLEDDKKITMPEAQSDWHDAQCDYVPFVDAHRRKRRQPSDSSATTSSEGEETAASASKPGGNQLPTDDFEAFKNDPIHQHHIRLSKATAESPQNVQVWLDLINHQGISFKDQSNVRGLGSASSRSLTDLKISLYLKALQQVKDQDGRETLILGLMQEGKKIWDIHKQTSEWETILQTNHSVELWKLYLNFKQTNALDHTSEECLTVYKRSLQVSQATEPGRARDGNCIYITLRLSLYLWQIDMTELAIGLWQALLELTFCSPRNQSRTQLLASFREYWDSESARIGEDGANGWGSGRTAEVVQKTDKKLESDHDMDLDRWALIETELLRSSGLPARSLDETSDEDPYRIVLFSDIEEYLFCPTTEKGACLLLDAFLLFCGLDPISSLSETGRWQTDPFVYSHFPSSKSSRMSPILIADATKSSEHQLSILESDTHNTAHHTNLISAANFPIGIYPCFIRRTLLQLTCIGHEIIPREILMQYVLSLEASIDLKVARKQAKSFLKNLPDSLRLYNSYALLEWQLGNADAAEKVWSTALSMQESLNAPKEDIMFSVWRDWVWSYMSQRLFQKAMLLLTAMPDGQVQVSRLQIQESSPSVGTRIRAERFIVLKLEASLVNRKPHDLVALTDILAFYRYLNSDCQLDAALQVYSKFLVSIERVAAEWLEILEVIHERRASLLHAHATTFGMPFKPKQLTTTLTESIHKFPDNCLLLWKQHTYTQQSGVLDRLREIDLRVPDHEQSSYGAFSIASICFDVSIELGRPSYSGSTDHSIRAAFQRATAQGSNGIYSVNLWKSYILWELAVGKRNHDILKGASGGTWKGSHIVRDAFHAALQACPWSKEIYLLPFQECLLKSIVGKEELKQLYHSMIQRGLRIRLDISDDLA